MEPALTVRARAERGAALLSALAATLFMLALGSALVLITATEVRIGGRYARGAEVLAAAELLLDRALLDIDAAGEWDLVLAGTTTSGLTDGPADGVRSVGDMSLDIAAMTNHWQCGLPSCGDAEVSAATAMRPWGVNNPRWQPFAWIPLDLVSASAPPLSPVYGLVWVADDPGENDGNPLRDGDTEDNPGRDTLLVLVEARGSGGLRRVLEASVRRTRNPDTGQPDGLELLAWREVR